MAPENRVVTMVVITLVYLLGAVFAVLRLKAIFSGRPSLFSATLAELEKDKETLSQMARAHEAAEEALQRERTPRSGADAYAPGRAAQS